MIKEQILQFMLDEYAEIALGYVRSNGEYKVEHVMRIIVDILEDKNLLNIEKGE